MKLIVVFCFGLMMLNLAFAEETYTNRFKLFNEFDKYLSDKPEDHADSYEVLLEKNGEFYGDAKFNKILPDDDEKSLKGTPEFVLKDGRLFHRGKLICDIKDGYPVPVNEVRPNNLSERQNDMTICIYLPFVYYKKDFFEKEGQKNGYGNHNYSIRTITRTGGNFSIKYKGNMFYKKRYVVDEESRHIVTALKDKENYLKCKNELFSNEAFVQFYNKVISCGIKKDLNCLKTFFPSYLKKTSPEYLKSMISDYGKIDLEEDKDLVLVFKGSRVNFMYREYFSSPYKNDSDKSDIRKLHRKMLVDNISKLIKQLPSDEFVCENKKDKVSLKYIFQDKEMEGLMFFKDEEGQFRLWYGETSGGPSEYNE